MFNAIVESVKSGGLNLIDTAVNFRYMKSERTVGAALKFLLAGQFGQAFSRDQLFVCSKAGYIPEDFDNGINYS